MRITLLSLALLLPICAFAGDVRVATGPQHTLVIAPDGTVMCQGRNNLHQCGIPGEDAKLWVDTLTPIPGLPKGLAVEIGDSDHSMVLGVDGKVYMWGQNPYGLLGGSDRGPKHVRETPTAVEGLSGATAIAACTNAGAALKADGSVWMWGSDEEGVMATGTVTLSGQSGKEYYVPRRVPIQEVSAIACGNKHMLALKKDGTVWSWGQARYGQLGLGDGERRGTPTQVTAISGATRVYASGSFSAAQLKDGSWLAWGSAPSPKETRDDKPSVLTPSPLPGVLRDAIEIEEGIALMKDGTVRTWGGNSFGFLGTGGSVDQDVIGARAVLVKALSGIVHVWGGGNRGVALKSDGTLYVWGPYKGDGKIQRTPVALTQFTAQ